MRPCPIPQCAGDVSDLVVTETGGFYRGQCCKCGLTAPGVRGWDTENWVYAHNAAIRRWNTVASVLEASIWQDEPPTEKGWHWFYHPELQQWVVAEVEAHPSIDELICKVLVRNHTAYLYWEGQNHEGSKFIGPLEEPKSKGEAASAE